MIPLLFRLRIRNAIIERLGASKLEDKRFHFEISSMEDFIRFVEFVRGNDDTIRDLIRKLSTERLRLQDAIKGEQNG